MSAAPALATASAASEFVHGEYRLRRKARQGAPGSEKRHVSGPTGILGYGSPDLRRSLTLSLAPQDVRSPEPV